MRQRYTRRFAIPLPRSHHYRTLHSATYFCTGHTTFPFHRYLFLWREFHFPRRVDVVTYNGTDWDLTADSSVGFKYLLSYLSLTLWVPLHPTHPSEERAAWTTRHRHFGDLQRLQAADGDVTARATDTLARFGRAAASPHHPMPAFWFAGISALCGICLNHFHWNTTMPAMYT